MDGGDLSQLRNRRIGHLPLEWGIRCFWIWADVTIYGPPHTISVSLASMSSSNRAPQRDGKAPASPVPPSPPAPPLRQSNFSADYWDDFYIGWKMALQKASRYYGYKGLNNILPDIGPRVEHIPSSPSFADRSGTCPSSADRSGTCPSSPDRSGTSPSSHPSPDRSASSPPCSTEWSVE
ncbi:hypothetical protein Taro_012010 [Colocasia esculenta]|uniref:Uncharacterized protein n=1 Tax=Colocasia esculenta TaxID=4460 RepID=A0A843U2X6_COLES|nr:hypothetical protein [Colocasia esculenta]